VTNFKYEVDGSPACLQAGRKSRDKETNKKLFLWNSNAFLGFLHLP